MVSSRSGAASRTTFSSSALAMTRARSPSASSSLNITTSPTCSNSSAATTLSASLSMTSWPRRRSSSSTSGLTLTRSLRPPVKTSTESSSLRCRKVPNPAGGWASRSTSSFSFVIWSRASRRVWASRSFWLVTAASDRWASASRSSTVRWEPGASLRRRRRSVTSASRKRTCPMSSSALRPASGPGEPSRDLPSDVDIRAPPCRDPTRAREARKAIRDGVGHDFGPAVSPPCRGRPPRRRGGREALHLTHRQGRRAPAGGRGAGARCSPDRRHPGPDGGSCAGASRPAPSGAR